MGVLDSGAIQRLAGSALRSVYSDAVLEVWRFGTARNPATGTFALTKISEHPCKAQRDQCTEAQRGQDGYSASDVRLIVLQSGLAPAPDTDDRVRLAGVTYRVCSVSQDPAGVYWDIRGVAA